MAVGKRERQRSPPYTGHRRLGLQPATAGKHAESPHCSMENTAIASRDRASSYSSRAADVDARACRLASTSPPSKLLWRHLINADVIDVEDTPAIQREADIGERFKGLQILAVASGSVRRVGSHER